MAKTRKRTTAAKPAAAEPAAIIDGAVESPPTHQTIATRAYELFLSRGEAHGQDWHDWLTAERELAPHEPGTDADYAG